MIALPYAEESMMIC